MNRSDTKMPPTPETTPPLVSLEDIEAALSGNATPEQHARFAAAMNDKDSELSNLLEYIRRNDRLGFLHLPSSQRPQSDQIDGELI